MLNKMDFENYNDYLLSLNISQENLDLKRYYI